MEIKFEQQNPTYASLSIHLEPADYADQVKKEVKKQAQKLALKGYRKGKVPYSVAFGYLGAEIKSEQVNKIVSESLNEYLAKQDFVSLAQPIAQSEPLTRQAMKAAKEFDFDFGLIIRQNLDLEQIDDLKFKKYEFELSEDDVDQTIDKIKNDLIVLTEADEVEESKGDLSLRISSYYHDGLEYEQYLQKEREESGEEEVSEEVKSELESNATKGLHFSLDELTEVGKEKLMGKKVDDEVEINVETDFLPDHKPELAETMSQTFQITIEAINHRDFPKMDQEFFDKVLGPGVVSSEEDFRKEIKKHMSQQEERSCQMLSIRDLREVLMERYKVEFSEEAISLILSASEKPHPSEKDIADLHESLNWMNIQQNFASHFDVNITEEQVLDSLRAKYRNMMTAYGLPANDQQVDTFMQRMLQGENANSEIEEVNRSLLNEMMLQIFSEKGSPEIVKVNKEELEQILSEISAQNAEKEQAQEDDEQTKADDEAIEVEAEVVNPERDE